jgi:transposase
VVFKANHQHQIMAFPPSLDELVAAGHPVRVVHEVLEKVDITVLLHEYKPGGTSSYHPRMLLKALVYAYINNIYSSRKIEEALQPVPGSAVAKDVAAYFYPGSAAVV